MAADDHAAAFVTVLPCGYRLSCRAPHCLNPATVIVRKAEGNGRFLRQIELCDEHGTVVVTRERARGLAIVDWRTRTIASST